MRPQGLTLFEVWCICSWEFLQVTEEPVPGLFGPNLSVGLGFGTISGSEHTAMQRAQPKPGPGWACPTPDSSLCVANIGSPEAQAGHRAKSCSQLNYLV